jgi:Metallo-peptidase family M12B Reprolysin-like
MGHQFGAHHTFNAAETTKDSDGKYTNNCNPDTRSSSTAYEPGSGSTIMGYAGICGSDDLQSHSDAYFHRISIDEIVAFTTSGGGNACGTGASSGNGIPTANAGADYTIPVRTPFTLTGSGSDPNGDTLTYDWEEFDLGAASPPNNPNSPPYLRSFAPVLSPSRTLPKISDIISNTPSKGEILPAVGGTLNFRLTVRDNRSGGGGVNDDSMQVSVAASAGPFLVTSPNSPQTWKVGESRVVTWDAANTTKAIGWPFAQHSTTQAGWTPTPRCWIGEPARPSPARSR